MSPPTRALGRNGPQVTAMGLGLMGLSGFYGTIKSDEERFKVLDRALELGETFWDSSDIYEDSEDLIGKWFKRTGNRDKIFLATKFGIVRYTLACLFVSDLILTLVGWVGWQVGLEGTTLKICGTREYVREACETSLKRLGVDCIDLYYIHRVSTETPIEETILEMVKLIKEGKIKHIGISECSASDLRRAHAIHPISAVQVEYSTFSLDIERPEIGLLATARELGVSIVAYSPLGRGMLTGAIKSPSDLGEGDYRKFMPRFSPENFGANLKLVDAIGELAKRRGVTPGQFALAWLMAQGEDIIPIPGTSKITNLEGNLDALKITLTPVENKKIRQASEAAEAFGERYDPGMMAASFVNSPPWKK